MNLSLSNGISRLKWLKTWVLLLVSLFLFVLVTKQATYLRYDITIVDENHHLGEQNENTGQISREFQRGSDFWRPVKSNPEIQFDFDELFDDRLLKQRKFIMDVSNSSFLKDLKPKRILVEFGVLPLYQYLDNGLHCEGDWAGAWETKCVLEKDTAFNDSEAQANRNLDSYDAVIETRHWFPKNYSRTIPKSSSAKQFIVTMETSFFTGNVDLSLNNAFLASYWRGSDIVIPYLKWIPFENHKELQEAMQDITNPNTSINYANGKSKLAAILVSNCNASNGRLEYVRELQRFMSVDVYGKCGLHDCSEPCSNYLGMHYKFYLAFENANCRDYITEKFFIVALFNNMIPVVLGAQKKDYLYAAPPNSFIHVEDFNSPSELAVFLKKVDENDTLYNTYFEWRNKGAFVTTVTDLYCRVCALLFLADFVKEPVWAPNSTWENVNVCLPRGRWYWNRLNNRSAVRCELNKVIQFMLIAICFSTSLFLL